MAPADRRRPAGRSVVVLGGTGFLGRRIADGLADRGARVHRFSRSGPGAVDLLTVRPERLAALLDAAGADTVVNAAGRAWRADEAAMRAGNADLVVRVAEALAVAERRPRLIQLGTVHEYGATTWGGASPEDQAPAPLTAYGRTKLLGTHAALDAARDRGVDTVVLRMVNVIGAGVPRGSLFGRVAATLGEAARRDAADAPPQVLRLPPLRVHRDLLDVRDAVEAVWAAAVTPAPYAADGAGMDRVINIGSGRAVSMRALIDRMVALSGVDLPVVEGPADPARPAEPPWLQLDITRARATLGWWPRRTPDDALRELLAAELPTPATAATAVAGE